MTDLDFEALAQLGLLDVLAALDGFSRSENNRAVYAIALGVMVPGDLPYLCINGEADIPLPEKHPRLNVEQEKYNAFGFKYCDNSVFSSDTISLFSQYRAATRELSKLQDTGFEASATLRAWIGSEWDRLYDGYFESLFRILNRLDGALAHVDLAPHCARYVYLGDNDMASRVKHFRATIPPALFAAVFPENCQPDSSHTG